nr:hypothetical protein [Tanacetum cinerariifolium]
MPIDPNHTLTILQPSSSKPKNTQKPRKPTRKDTQIASLKRRVKKLEKRNRSRTHKLKRLYKVGLSAKVESYGDEESLSKDASKQGRIDAIDADKDITLVFVARKNGNVVEEVVDAAQVSTAATTITITTEEIILAQALEALKTSKPKVKGLFFKSQKDLQERERAEKEQEVNIALIEEWDDIHEKIDVDHQLAKRLQAQGQEELYDAKRLHYFNNS